MFYQALPPPSLDDVVAPFAISLADLFGAFTDVMLVDLAHPARPPPGLRGRGPTAAAQATVSTAPIAAAISASAL